MLSGKKSTPSRGYLEAVAETITAVSPQRTMQDPPACPQYFPDSTINSLPPSSILNT